MSVLGPCLGPVLGPYLQPITARPLGGAFSPRSLFAAGEQGAWYDPSDLSSLFQDAAGTTPVTAVGQPVGLMLDKSGRGNHTSQTTATSRPLLQQDAGGRYYLAFDGVDDVLSATSGMGSASLSTFFAVRWDVIGTSRYVFGNAANAGGISLFKSSGDLLVVQYGTGAAMANLVMSTALVGTPYILGGDTTGSLVNGYVNTATPTASTTSANPAGAADSSIFANYAKTGYGQGRMYGSVTIGRLIAATERANVIRYLAKKSGVTLP